MCVCFFWCPNLKYMFVQAHVGAVFAIQKSNICVSKLMCVLFLCARQWSMISKRRRIMKRRKRMGRKRMSKILCLRRKILILMSKR